MEKSRLFLIINALSFYIYWWFSFWGASIKQYHIGPLIAIIYFIFHFYMIFDKKKEFQYMLLCMFCGFLLESAFFYFQFIDYNGILPDNYSIIPIWVIVLWGGYALTVYHSFNWIYGKYYSSLMIGGLLGPLIYLSGDRMGCINFQYDAFTSYLILSPVFAVCFLLLNYFAVKLNND